MNAEASHEAGGAKLWRVDADCLDSDCMVGGGATPPTPRAAIKNGNGYSKHVAELATHWMLFATEGEGAQWPTKP